MHRPLLAAACAAFIWAAPGAVAASAQGDPPPRAARGATPTNAEVATLLDAYALVQAQNVLQLDDEQYGRFVPRLNRLHETRRKNTQARARLMAELRKLIQSPSTDDALIRERLDALRTHDEQAAAALRKAYDAVDEVLTPRQQVRFRMFETQLEARKLELLLRARERARTRN